MAYPRFQRARAFKFATRTSADVTIPSSGGFAVVDAALNLTLDAQVGDVIEYGLSAQWGNGGTGGRIRVVTMVSGSAVNQTLGDATYGIAGYTGQSGVYTAISGSHMYTLVSGDLSSGTVTLQLQAKTDGGTTKQLQASSTSPLHVWAKNLGPADPH